MANAFDTGAPTLQVNVYEGERLVTRVACESPEEAAGIVAEWEAREGMQCIVEDLAVRHGADDVLAPEPEDAFEIDEDRAR